jgi:hypothetical protein
MAQEYIRDLRSAGAEDVHQIDNPSQADFHVKTDLWQEVKQRADHHYRTVDNKVPGIVAVAVVSRNQR